MKISIENFKSIRKLHNFEIKPLTILSGINSAGKSSFVQLLLLLKQTVEANNKPFVIDGNLYVIGEYKDVIYKKDLKNTLSVSFEFDKSEFNQIDNLKTVSIFNSFSNYKCLIEIEYNGGKDNEIYISLFTIRFTFEKHKEHYIIFKSNSDNTFSIDTNSAIFGKELLFEEKNILNIKFSSIYPDKYESEKIEDVEVGDQKSKLQTFSKETVNIEDVKTIINSFLTNISYLEPSRELPKDNYLYSINPKNVGTKGEYTAQILEEEAQNSTTYYEIEKSENRITYKENKNKTLVEAVNYWVCGIFEIANNIRAEKTNETYKIILTNKSGLETSIKHVGFGISQLLPIIIEGLIMPNNGTLIIEQPEIHLHPKLQSKLYDFLYSLTLQGKKIIVETHSSHFITRMRRRIAEDESNEMDNQIGLTFIEGNIFRSIELDDYGTMDYYPEDFIEASNTELKAIVKAQIKKRKKND